MSNQQARDRRISHLNITVDQFRTPLGDRILFLLAATGVIAGWMIRDQKLIIAEEGIGYILGIVGGSMMLLLLLYPVRKKAKWMRNLGKIHYWFRMHMTFGILGPLLVVYHSNFHLGSLNSRVALYCMLLVAFSGLIGRYFYTKVHYGLYGHVATLRQLTNGDHEIRKKLKLLLQDNPETMEKIEHLEQTVMQPPSNPLLRVISFLLERPRVFFSGLIIKKQIDRNLGKMEKFSGLRAQIKKKIENEIFLILDEHFFLLQRIAHFRFFERMLALWHLFHYPFFIMMVVSALVHVVVVHVY